MAIYEMDTDDVQKALDELASRAGTPEMFMSPSLDLDGVLAAVFDPITPRVIAK